MFNTSRGSPRRMVHMSQFKESALTLSGAPGLGAQEHGCLCPVVLETPNSIPEPG